MARVAFLLLIGPTVLKALAPAPLPAFSAECSYYADGERQWGKVFAAGDLLRIEVQQGRVVWLVDSSKQAIVEVLEGQVVNRSTDADRVTQLRGMAGGPLGDLAKPCAETLSWFGDQPKPGERDTITVRSCKRLERVRMNGRDTDKWAMTIGAGGETAVRYLWVDSELGRAIRIETAELEHGQPAMVFEELRNIGTGPQPATLFEVPAPVNGKP